MYNFIIKKKIVGMLAVITFSYFKQSDQFCPAKIVLPRLSC